MDAHTMTMMYRILGARIRARRVELGLSQEALANKVRVSRVSIVNIEKGRQHPPLHLLWDIAETLSTNSNELIPNQAEVVKDEAPALSELAAKYGMNNNGDEETVRGLSHLEKIASTNPIRPNGKTKQT